MVTEMLSGLEKGRAAALHGEGGSVDRAHVQSCGEHGRNWSETKSGKVKLHSSSSWVSLGQAEPHNSPFSEQLLSHGPGSIQPKRTMRDALGLRPCPTAQVGG